VNMGTAKACAFLFAIGKCALAIGSAIVLGEIGIRVGKLVATGVGAHVVALFIGAGGYWYAAGMVLEWISEFRMRIAQINAIPQIVDRLVAIQKQKDENNNGKTEQRATPGGSDEDVAP
jgi:hypothetical protein